MKIRNSDRDAEDIKLDMTAMIDVVFQLLVFFVMTFKTPVYEGDFGIKMPMVSEQPSMNPEVTDETMFVRMVADENRNLNSLTIEFGMDTLNFPFDPANPEGCYVALQNYAIELVGTQADPSGGDIEAELDIDKSLRYRHTVSAIEAISGYKQGDQVVQLIEKVNFKDVE